MLYMNRRSSWLLVFAGALLLMSSGCSSLLPTSDTVTRSKWKNYHDVDAAFAKVVPFQTRTNDLKSIGFHPSVSPNVHVLTYVEVMQRFMPNPAITKADLPDAVRDCLAAREKSYAYEVDLSDTHSKRHGNLFLDVFGFKRRTTETGWQFKGLVLINDGLVVYKLSAGDPMISRESSRTKPLGPFQELDAVVTHSVSLAP